jgi:hypothetical protein
MWNSMKEVIVNRFLSFTMVLGIGFMLLVSLVISTGLTALGNWIGTFLPQNRKGKPADSPLLLWSDDSLIPDWDCDHPFRNENHKNTSINFLLRWSGLEL